MSIAVSCIVGTHNDSQITCFPVFYALGSYIPHALPHSFTYIYVLLHNTTSNSQYIEHVWAENAHGFIVDDMQLPPTYREHVLKPHTYFVLGFSQHLLTRCLQWAGLHGVQHMRFCVRTAEKSVSCSAPIELHMHYPRTPLEDVELIPYAHFFLERARRYEEEKQCIECAYGSLWDYANVHEVWGVHKAIASDGTPYWLLREYMPAAKKLWLTTDKLNFQRWAHHEYHPMSGAQWQGWWQLALPFTALEHGTYMELRVLSAHMETAERRVPAMARWVEQDALIPTQWCARHYAPAQEYLWRHSSPVATSFLRLYEAHIGMAQEALERPSVNSVGSFAAFTQKVLPRIAHAGYTHVQLMGVVEHPLYKSYGYQVSSYFAPSSRFGSERDFKILVDTAHSLGLRIILDIAHSHACPNTEQGIAFYDGSSFFFSPKTNQWGTASFDYSQEITRRFLLSNCRYWMEEYHIDGFRFDAVGNMLYIDHGHDDDFSHVGRCFYGKDGQNRGDVYGQLYLSLANDLINTYYPTAESIAEEFSGMPGLTCAAAQGGLGFTHRFAMGIPDFWAKYIRDEQHRSMGTLWHEMTNHRIYDRTVSYVECHDQSINGKDAMIWRIMGDAMYTHMELCQQQWSVSRGMALYKLMRCITLCTADCGYLNFMGAEFGHPEWLDDTVHAHRQWHLADATNLRYQQLALFDYTCLHNIIAKHLTDFALPPLFRHIDEEKKILAFERGKLLMLYNFHELTAQDALHIMVTPGKYVEILSSDAKQFGGYGNLDALGTEHFSDAHSGVRLQAIRLYLPPMAVLVLIRH